MYTTRASCRHVRGPTRVANHFCGDYTPSVIYCPRVLRDIILLVLKDAHVMCSGVADKIQPYRIDIVVAGANLKMAYSYILENFHFYLSNLGITSNFCGAL